jgi:membrane protease YdiL (CAAX protease family)
MIRNMPLNTAQRNGRQEVRPVFAVVVLVCFFLAIAIPKLFKASAWYRSQAVDWSVHIRWWIQPAWWLFLIAMGCGLLWLMRRNSEEPIGQPTLGLRTGWKSAAIGILFALACTIPMLALGFLSPEQTDTSDLFYTTVQAGFVEELLFRGFAFGMLVQLGRVRVWPAAILTGVVFGAVHLSSFNTEAVQREFVWIAMIAVGGVLYAWLFWRWKWNLWVIIALHLFMNLWWGVWDLGENTLGPWAVTVARVMTLTLAVTLSEFAAKSERLAKHFQNHTIPE